MNSLFLLGGVSTRGPTGTNTKSISPYKGGTTTNYPYNIRKELRTDTESHLFIIERTDSRGPTGTNANGTYS